jgi:hypothetical protein
MPFNIQNQTFLSKKRPVYEGSSWTRAADWVSITSVPTNEMYFLVADNEPFYRINVGRFSGAGTCYVDWGDGTVDTFTGSTAIQHSYVAATGGTACSRGYNTWKVRVYADSGTVLQYAYFNINTQYNRTSLQPSGLLEAWYGDSINFPLNSLSGIFYSQTNYPTFNFLEYVKFPASMPNVVTMANLFRASTGIRKVVMPTSAPLVTDLSNAFSNCTNISEVILPSNMTGLTTLSGTFNSCNSLLKITFPTSLNSVTTIASMCNGANSLKEINMPALPLCTTLSNAFQNCYSLTFFQFPTLPTSGLLTLLSMFSACYSLESVNFPRSASNVSLSNTFITCPNLKYVFFPKEMAGCITSMNQTFNGCTALKTVLFPSANDANITLYGQPITDFASCFINCNNLEEIKLPDGTAASTSFASAFSGCVALSDITIGNNYVITSLASAFSGCRSLRRVTLPANAQNSLTSMDSTFINCNSLTTVTLPTSMTALTTLASAFSACPVLTSVTFPSALNSVTTIGSTFSSCASLISVTLPTSMSLCTVFASTSSGCSSLKTVTLPATVPATLSTFSAIFSGCNSLTTVTLPTTQTTSLNTMTTMFSGCGQLRTINNMQYLGATATGGTACAAGGFMITAEEYAGTLDLYMRLSQFAANGSATAFSKLTGVRFRNVGTAGQQWGGANPAINISYTSISTASLNTLFADLAAQGNVSAKTITITSATGAAGLTAADRLVLTSRGWTITG